MQRKQYTTQEKIAFYEAKLTKLKQDAKKDKSLIDRVEALEFAIAMIFAELKIENGEYTLNREPGD